MSKWLHVNALWGIFDVVDGHGCRAEAVSADHLAGTLARFVGCDWEFSFPRSYWNVRTVWTVRTSRVMSGEVWHGSAGNNWADLDGNEKTLAWFISNTLLSRWGGWRHV